MHYRLESKQLSCSASKLNDLAELQKKAIRRVNFNYTQHVILQSNCQQKKLDMLSVQDG